MQKYATNKDYEEILNGMANYALQEKSGGCADILSRYCTMEFDLQNLDALLSGSLALKDYDKIEKVLKAAAENNISFKSSNNELCARCPDKKSLQIFKEYGIRPEIKKREDISTLLLTSNINPEILDFVVNDCDLRDKIVPHTDYLLNIWKRRSNHDHLKENILWLLDNGFPKELDYAKVYKSSSETAMLNHVFNLRSRGVDVQNSELIFDIMQSKDIAVFKGLINSKLIDASKPPILYKALLAKTKKDFVSYILKKGGDFFAEMPNGDPQYFGIMLKRDLDAFLLHNNKIVDYSTKAENGNTWFNNICRNFTQFNLRIKSADNIDLYSITNGKKKLDLTVKDELGKTPLHNMIYSVAMENVSSAGSLPSSFTELLNNKNGHIKNVNLQDASGNTIGHYLAAFATKLSDSSRWFTTLFNEHGLDLTVKNAKGISVASLAKINIGNGFSDEMSTTLDKILLEMALPESENKKTKKFKI